MFNELKRIKDHREVSMNDVDGSDGDSNDVLDAGDGEEENITNR